MKAIYIRTSTEEQTPELQLRDIATIVDIKDIPVYQDKQSAWKDNIDRVNFTELILQIKKGKVNALYIWDWDRLYRNRLKLKDFFALCKMFNCKVHSYRQNFMEDIHRMPTPFNSIMEDMLINFLGWVAEDESKKKSERIKMAIRKEDGKTYSYKGNVWGKKNISTQARTKIIELHTEGKTIREICQLVEITDKNNNMRNVSIGCVHKTITNYKAQNKVVKDNEHKLDN
jgi:DNA invertase Pin-like site-specific DNA recombinase